MRVEHVMTRDVVTVPPDLALKQVATTLATRGVSGVPVVAAGTVVGVVSETDVVRVEQGRAQRVGGGIAWLKGPAGVDDARLEARTAGEAMSAPAVAVAPGATVAEAARLMIEHRVTRLPVVLDGVLVGIVSRGDLVRAFARSDEEISAEIYEDVLVNTLWIGADRVAVEVEGGVVRLTGETQTRTEAELLEAYARRVPGVSTVESALRWSIDDLKRRSSVFPGEPFS